jgi:hypothetical protein
VRALDNLDDAAVTGVRSERGARREHDVHGWFSFFQRFQR